jgi:hypothetical protein
MRIRDGKNLDPGWRNSDPGSGINIPDPQHCFFLNSNPFARQLAQANYTERSKTQSYFAAEWGGGGM